MRPYQFYCGAHKYTDTAGWFYRYARKVEKIYTQPTTDENTEREKLVDEIDIWKNIVVLLVNTEKYSVFIMCLHVSVYVVRFFVT